MSESTDGLEVLEIPSEAITINGKTVKVTPVRVKDLKVFAKHARAVVGVTEDDLALVQLAMTGDPVALLQVVEERADSLIACIATGVKIDPAEMGEWDLGELVRAVVAVVKVNKDFFTRNLMPWIAQVSEQAIQQAAGLGATPFNPSSATVTH